MSNREQELQKEIEELRKKLEIADKEKTEAQEMSAAMAEASAFSGNAEERPTGNTIEVRVCLNPHVRKEADQKWKTVKMPTYYYAINLPAGAGVSLMTNGLEYFHGQTYELDHDTLADIKSRVARCWDHEKSIHGDNANAYRKPTNLTVGANGVSQPIGR